ncbi:AbrB/MazE/SpoVT family DNA-binding domain-containing protein [Phragmitibacter flavus]|uniref:AbrB/MazE/SpoVT family DNA-binding domain-containing protein n=1 Tax=Phragmitibacter flavus TaxID=2576071 RepID=A0A5R8KCU0_9BACT|nr:AbrB/MazE/SpoVT family DNA-binding domain-containing protein [Phragmitibacter flavus]TLD70103.1 AbrB/MazE/SpoVT family DNA-binding domain-containing protein [Phragmitibacter flavus]
METMVFKSGNSLAVRLPKGFELPPGKVSLSKVGDKIVIEKLTSDWPEGFFEDIQIKRKSFGRELVTYSEKSL